MVSINSDIVVTLVPRHVVYSLNEFHNIGSHFVATRLVDPVLGRRLTEPKMSPGGCWYSVSIIGSTVHTDWRPLLCDELGELWVPYLGASERPLFEF